MNEKEKKAIENCRLLLMGDITVHIQNEDGATDYYGEVNKLYNEDLETVLNLIEKQQEEIEKKDKTVKHIIERLENDIKRITETKTKKSEHYLDDYTRNRLKAYKTKTKEIKEYIEEQYFNQKIEKGEEGICILE